MLDRETNGGGATDGDVVAAFTQHYASLIDVDERRRLLSRVKMDAMRAAPEEAFERAPIGRTAAELLAETPVEPDWLIPGVAARGWMVKFAAREKTGKGTLIAYLLGRLERGEATVFGAAAAPTTALIYTEEPQDSIREKIDRAGLREAFIVYGYALAGHTWPEKVDRLVTEASERGAGVVFVDNISRAAGIEDEAGVELARAAEHLGETAKAAGLTVLIDHHHKKGAGKLADKSRGGTALAGACDNNVEMVRPGNDWQTRVRKLSSLGRLTACLWEQTVALSEDGRDFEMVAGDTQPQTAGDRRRLRILRDAGDDGVTAKDFAGQAGIGDTMARTVLDEFVGKGWATQDDERPARWRSTGEGLDDPVDLLSGEFEAGE